MALVVSVAGCDSGPTQPAIADVTVAGTFALQLLDPAESVFTGTALFNYCAGGSADRGLRLRTPSWPGEYVAMFPQIGFPVDLIPVPAVEHRFSEFAVGSRGYTIRHERRALSGVAFETGVPTPDGSVEIIESSMSTLRGRIELRFNYYVDSASPPTSRRLRGSFWAVADPACAVEF